MTRRNTIEDFHDRIDRSGDCWVWVGSINQDGYGEFAMAGTTHRAHRLSYELAKGPIPSGLHIDHLCRVRSCVNPDHLEAVTAVENMRRGLSSYAIRTHCRSGQHDITLPGAILVGPHGRQCLECQKAVWRKRSTSEKRREYVREWERAKRARLRSEAQAASDVPA